jgi:hypothetical protein
MLGSVGVKMSERISENKLTYKTEEGKLKKDRFLEWRLFQSILFSNKEC